MPLLVSRLRLSLRFRIDNFPQHPRHVINKAVLFSFRDLLAAMLILMNDEGTQIERDL